MRVAAIVSAYVGAERWLEGRLANLLQLQTERPGVVVVCQDGSPEDVVARQWQLSNEYQLHTVLTGNVPTIYEAWNLGIMDAIEQWSPDYITNANSDDRLHPQGIQLLARALDKSHKSVGVVYSDVDVIGPGTLDAFDVGMGFDEAQAQAVQKFRWAEGGLAQLLEGCFLGPMPMWRAELHKEHGLFDPEMHSAGDYEFWLRLASKGVGLYHVKQVLGLYLAREDSAEHREPLRAAWETARARGRYRPPERPMEVSGRGQ